MGRPRHQYEAWVVGQHVVPPELASLERATDTGDVIVRNLTMGTVDVLPARQFERQYEWA